MVWGEVSLTHPTAHARLAIREMVMVVTKRLLDRHHPVVSRRPASLLAAARCLEYVFGIAGAPLALIGLMLFENAYVQAGQSVPFA